MRYTNRRAFTQGSAFRGLEHAIFTFSLSKPPKKPFWGTHNGKPTANTYSHNFTMYAATTLKFGKLFDLILPSTWVTHKSFSVRGLAGG